MEPEKLGDNEGTKNVIHVVPKNSELEKVTVNQKLSDEMKEAMCQLYTSDNQLKDMILQEMEVANILALELMSTGKHLDFSWKEYILRDVVIKQIDDVFCFTQNLRMLGLTDRESSEILHDMINGKNMKHYMSVLLYYGAPSDSDVILSRVRFMDIMAIDKNDNFHRRSFFRYTREL